jgi:hypothetical protein
VGHYYEDKKVSLLEYILYCDESSQKGPKYSDFFGGCIISSKDFQEVTEALESKKSKLLLRGEVKWSKVTKNYLNKYVELITLFFTFIRAGKVKVRIMFRNNINEPSDPQSVYIADDKYFKLYYQFIKNAFGFRYLTGKEPVYVRVYLDQLPDKKEKCADFKNFLMEMPLTSDLFSSPLRIRSGDIAEVKSHDHVLLQCLDIVLGSMFFRLNLLHKKIPEGQRFRGKRTVAKEKLYKHIYNQINDIFPRFNIGESTGNRGDTYPDFYWNHPYRHWNFTPK